MFSQIPTLLALLALTSRASAHGWIGLLSVDGQVYKGPSSRENDGVSTTPSVVWQVGSQGPVTDLGSADMACGNGADTPAALAAPAKAGSNITLQWVNGNGGSWIHPWGPMQTYLADCGGSCAEADPTRLAWFKISEIGQSKPKQNVWYMADLLDGSATRLTLPSDLAPRNYLLRHELTAKHLSPPELFISCSSLVVSGLGSSTPSPSETARFPGAYAATDPGMVLDIFNGPFTFVFPGPPLAAMADGAFAIVPHLSAAGKTMVKGVAAAAGSVVKAAPAFNPSSSTKSSSSKLVKTSSTSGKATTCPKTTTSAQTTTTKAAAKSTSTVTVTSIVTSIETDTVTTTKTASPHTATVTVTKTATSTPKAKSKREAFAGERPRMLSRVMRPLLH